MATLWFPHNSDSRQASPRAAAAYPPRMHTCWLGPGCSSPPAACLSEPGGPPAVALLCGTTRLLLGWSDLLLPCAGGRGAPGVAGPAGGGGRGSAAGGRACLARWPATWPATSTSLMKLTATICHAELPTRGAGVGAVETLPEQRTGSQLAQDWPDASLSRRSAGQANPAALLGGRAPSAASCGRWFFDGRAALDASQVFAACAAALVTQSATPGPHAQRPAPAVLTTPTLVCMPWTRIDLCGYRTAHRLQHHAYHAVGGLAGPTAAFHCAPLHCARADFRGPT